MTRPLRIAQVAPVATSVPPPRSGSIELLTSQLTDGLVARGHEVTLFAAGDSTTRATLHATFARGYRDDETLWAWELCELMNVAAALERAGQFDLIHCQSEYYPLSLAFGRLVLFHHQRNMFEERAHIGEFLDRAHELLQILQSSRRFRRGLRVEEMRHGAGHDRRGLA